MQSLGDNTLAAFSKLDSFRTGETSNINKSTNATKVNEEDSDLGKYFKDSIVSFTKNSDKSPKRATPKSPRTPKKSPRKLIRSRPALDIVIESKNSFRNVQNDKNNSNDRSASPELTRFLRNPRSPRKIFCGASKVRMKKIPSAGAILSSTDKKSDESKSLNKAENLTDISKPSTSRFSRTVSNIELPRTIIESSLSVNESSLRNDQNLITELSVEIPSIINSQDRVKLAYWGLPLTILRKYESRGVISMFPWQVECLRNPAIIEKGKNLVYSAPTSAGKTLVSEILIIKTVLERKKKVIFVLPFVSVVREKMYYFQDLLSEAGIRVEGFMGGVQPPGGFNATDMAIATIEKANSLINQLMEEGGLENLGAVVIDELHLLGDSHRGYLLELLLTKLKFMTLKEEHVNIQLIGMSATLPNLHILANWLDAELYKTDFRPVPLKEFCKIGSTIYDNQLNQIRELSPLEDLPNDSENILQLCLETILDSHSVLIFCPSKNWCETLAKQVSTVFFKLGTENRSLGQRLRNELSKDAIMETLEQLKRTPVGLDKILRQTVSFGVAFHHAGLTMDERDVIEGAFRSGALRVLTATSTLSSGVNLPARRVIIRTPIFHGQTIDILTYKQMIGRAGRMGRDTAGESILVCKPHERNAVIALLKSDLKPIESCLEGARPLVRALLEAVASEVAYTLEDIVAYMKCTLLNFSNNSNVIEEITNQAITFLVENELLLLQKSQENMNRWVATQLGKACLAASVPPADGLFLFEELQKARKCFVLDTELHVIYLVTPFNSASQIGQIDWYVYLDIWKNISDSEQRVGHLVGVTEAFLASALKRDPKPGKSLDIHKRFFTALALHDLVREIPLHTVCQKYSCSRGVIQSLQQTASTFAGMVTQFCKKLGWSCIELLVSQFQARLQFGVCSELLDLLRLPTLNGLRARSLFKSGIKSVAELAVADELDVERALYKALPFESEKEQDGEHENDAVRRNKMRTVFVTGKDGLTPREAAKMLVKEARSLVQNELGLNEMQWENKSKKKDESNIEASQGYCGTGSTISGLSKSFIDKNEESKNVNETRSNVNQSVDQTDKNQQNTVEVKENVSVNTVANHCKSKNTSLFNEKSESEDNISEVMSGNSNLSELVSGHSNLSELISGHSNISDLISIHSNERAEDEGNKILDVALDNLTIGLDSDDEIFESEPDNIILKKETIHAEAEKVDEVMEIDNEVFEEEPRAASVINTNIESGLFSTEIENEEISSINHPTVVPETIPESESVGDARKKDSFTPSPNIFDDSLNVDSQELNILEKNIVDLDSVVFNETHFSQASSRMNKNSMGSLITSRVEQIQKDRVLRSNRSGQTRPSPVTSNKSIIWEEDTWSKTKLTSPIEKSNQSEFSKMIAEKAIFESPKPGPSNIDGKKGEFTPPLPRRKSTESNSVEKSQVNKIHRLSQRRYSSPSANKSPIASLITYDTSRRLSTGSSKSEDDIIIPSQSVDIIRRVKKTRARMRIDSLRTQQTQKTVEKSVISSQATTNINITEERTILSSGVGVKRRLSSSDNQSKKNSIGDDGTQSVVLNSDDESIPAKRRNILSTSRKLLSKPPTKKVRIIREHYTLNELSIVNISESEHFDEFKAEMNGRREISMALACEVFSGEITSIGTRIIGGQTYQILRKLPQLKGGSAVYNDKKLCGIGFSWGQKVYYLPFENSKEANKVPVKKRMELLTEIFSSASLKIRCYNCKEIYKMLYKCCGLTPVCKFLDSSTANWMLNPDYQDRTFANLITEFLPEGFGLLQKLGPLSVDAGPGMNVKSSTSSELRCCTETLLSWYLLECLGRKLGKMDPALLTAFKEVEMGTMAILARMELSGLGVNLVALQELADVIQQELTSLENKAFALAGRKFNFSSPRSVAEVLKLTTGKKISTSKMVLERCDHPIAKLVLSWRKLSTTFTKVVCPLLSACERSSRIHGNCFTNTVTGRVSMYDPNLQNIPRDFEVADNSFTISIRMAFVPAPRNVLLSADYCQLELRILAHYSKEPTLMSILKKPGDVFKNIAAQWHNTSESQVDDKMRQRAKQLIYAMIYGMGVKTLAETLQVEESEARDFQDTFMGAYPGLKKWINETLERARKKGFVRTLMRRRRMLPALNSEAAGEKGQAERQAINTKIQGSAADIAKKAMILVDEKIRAAFEGMPMVLPDEPLKRKLRRSQDFLPRGAYLVLQLHDELLYEVNATDLNLVARIVKESMEQAHPLSVPLPVKIKSGPAWGDLTEYNFNQDDV
ncbi:DNA polymerase theta [Chelonus insularis]|uniref:DNA polymerase theta n=1 Tax=Chelonus insularis TaxID=460826 RepID=UPI00158AF0FF|nr:DNA polymerase theta [Chelonus insularis]